MKKTNEIKSDISETENLNEKIDEQNFLDIKEQKNISEIILNSGVAEQDDFLKKEQQKYRIENCEYSGIKKKINNLKRFLNKEVTQAKEKTEYKYVPVIFFGSDGSVYLQGGIYDEFNSLFDADFPRRKQYIEERRVQICYPDGYREYGIVCTAEHLTNIDVRALINSKKLPISEQAKLDKQNTQQAMNFLMKAFAGRTVLNLTKEQQNAMKTAALVSFVGGLGCGVLLTMLIQMLM